MIIVADGILVSTFSFAALLTLVVVFCASLAMFYVLIRRWTSHRFRLELEDFGREHDFKLVPIEFAKLPPPLDLLAEVQPRWLMEGKQTKLVQIHSTTAQLPADATAMIEPQRWNVLIRKIARSWQPTGVRPTHHKSSLLDLFSLASFPTLMSIERYTIYSNDSASARTISKSSIPSLLPGDIGLLVVGEYLLLDFSARPFDPIEFGRLIALADQMQALV